MGPANSQFHLCKVLYNLEKKFSPFHFPVGLQVPVHSKRDGHFLATLIPFRINGVGASLATPTSTMFTLAVPGLVPGRLRHTLEQNGVADLISPGGATGGAWG